MLPRAVELLLEHAPVAAETDGDRVSGGHAARARGGESSSCADWFLEASETGALLALAGVEHVTGFESQAMTGEPHAPAEHQPDNLQPVGVCFAVEHLAGEDHTIPRPARYDFAAHFTWVRAPHPGTTGPSRAGSSPTPTTTRWRSGRTSRTPTSTKTSGASAGSPPAASSRPAPTAPTSRSSTGRRSTTGRSPCSTGTLPARAS